MGKQETIITDAVRELVRERDMWKALALSLDKALARKPSAKLLNEIEGLKTALRVGQPTKSQVMASRRGAGGCCNRYCDMMACDCLENAAED